MKKWLVLILLLATILRFWNLGTYPDAIDEDEMALGYYGYSLLTNGTDEYGNILPLYFESVGDYKYGLYSYFAAIPIGLFGLNAFTTRSISAIAGVLSVLLIYFLSLEIFKKQKLGLMTAFVLAVAPIHIQFSRIAYNNILGSLFALAAILFLIKYYKFPTTKRLAVAFGFFILGILSYQAYRIFLPLSFIFISALYVKKINRKFLAKPILVSLAAVVLVLVSFIPTQSRARSQQLSNLTEIPKLIEYYSEDGMSGQPLVLTRLLHNKYQSFGMGFVKRYLEYFDPIFLFVETSSNTTRHSIPETGLLYLIELPFFAVGLATMFYFTKQKEKYIPIILLLTAPIAASLVLESNSTTRALIIVYGFVLIIAFGIYHLVHNKKLGKVFIIIVLGLYFANFVYYSHQFLVHKTYHHPWYSDVGLKEMVEQVNQNYDKYSAIVVSKGHYMPFLFFNKIHPKEFMANSELLQRAVDSGTKVKSFGKVYFNMPVDCPAAGKANVLYVCFGSQLPPAASIVSVIRFKDDQPAIMLVEYSSQASTQALPDKVHYSSNVDSRFDQGLLPVHYPSYWPLQD